MLAKDPVQQPAPAQVVGVYDRAVAQLDPLPRPVDPGEVEVESGLDEPKNDGYRVWGPVVAVELAPYPVEDVEPAVGAEEEDVEGGDDGGDRGLPEEEELRKDADGFEDYGEGEKPLVGRQSANTFSVRWQGNRRRRTIRKLQ